MPLLGYVFCSAPLVLELRAFMICMKIRSFFFEKKRRKRESPVHSGSSFYGLAHQAFFNVYTSSCQSERGFIRGQHLIWSLLCTCNWSSPLIRFPCAKGLTYIECTVHQRTQSCYEPATIRYLPSVGWHYEEGFNFMFLEEGVPFMSISRLHLVISI